MTIFDQHTQTCLRCRQRLARESGLLRLRRDPVDTAAENGSVRYACLSAPVGTVWVASGQRGLISVEYAVDEAAFCHSLESRGYGFAAYDEQSLRNPVRQLKEFFSGGRTTFDLSLDLTGLTPFQRTVLEAVSRVPYGTVQSYGGIARAAGWPRAPRAAGGALAINPISIVIPCHRVIRSDGQAGEYGRDSLGPCGPKYKLMLLALEGVTWADEPLSDEQ
jgi:methylated-DNA-[protein]-cysteine S-methyltransferase